MDRFLIKTLAKLVAPIVEEATLQIHRRRGAEARTLGMDGLGESFYRIFGQNLTGSGDEEDRQSGAPALQPSVPDRQSSVEAV
jgi:hypothetical protein